MADGVSAEKKILLIDDDAGLATLMAEFFRQHHFQCEAVHDGGRGLARALEGQHDIILLDVMLPVLDGFELLRQIRRRSAIPVIMLTARVDQKDRIAGLDAGADDYLPKPFGPEELLARIRAVLRRAGQFTSPNAAVLQSGELRLDPSSREVWLRKDRVEVTQIEFDILELLARAAGRIVPRDEITAALFQRQATPYERSLDVHISHLRKKLTPNGESIIRTARGVGYSLAPGGGDAE